MDPTKKLNEVMKAIPSGVKKSLSFELLGMSLQAYIINRPNEVIVAYLKMVPYYVTKKPSEPSLITSAISCILLGPTSCLKISHSMLKATPMNTNEMVKAENEITLEVDFETNK
tara:strand:+ start:133 stop:474 length:342 start_codon:yes stop_codon:yes gene_type:complete